MEAIKNPLQYLCALQEDEVKLNVGLYFGQSGGLWIDPEYFGPLIVDFFKDKPGVLWSYGYLSQESNNAGDGVVTAITLIVNESMLVGGAAGLWRDLERWIDFVANNPHVVMAEEGELAPMSDLIPEEIHTRPVELQLDTRLKRPLQDTATNLPYNPPLPAGTSKAPMNFGTTTSGVVKTPISYTQGHTVTKKP